MALKESYNIPSACFKVLFEYMRFILHFVFLIFSIIEQNVFSYQLSRKTFRALRVK